MMLVEHYLEIATICPVDHKPDIYSCVIRVARVLPVEDILKAIKDIQSGGPIYQEDLTRELHRVLSAQVETVGWHSGIRTRVIIGSHT